MEVRAVEVRFAEVRFNRGLFHPPDIPSIDALLEEIEMLWVGHWCVASRLGRAE